MVTWSSCFGPVVAQDKLAKELCSVHGIHKAKREKGLQPNTPLKAMHPMASFPGSNIPFKGHVPNDLTSFH
jgi:hypothetical protein